MAGVPHPGDDRHTAALVIEFRNVGKIYRSLLGNSVKAVEEFSLQVNEGEILGIAGPNGAGKTTLISALGGLVRPDSGALAVAGHDVERDYRAARRSVGIVPQEILYDPFFTVRETLELQSGYFGLRRNASWIEELIDEGRFAREGIMHRTARPGRGPGW